MTAGENLRTIPLIRLIRRDTGVHTRVRASHTLCIRLPGDGMHNACTRKAWKRKRRKKGRQRERNERRPWIHRAAKIGFHFRAYLILYRISARVTNKNFPSIIGESPGMKDNSGTCRRGRVSKQQCRVIEELLFLWIIFIEVDCEKSERRRV